MKKLLFTLFFFLALPVFVHAQENMLEFTPRIIDEKAYAGDILKYDVVIKNISDRKLDLYPMVNDLSPEDGSVDYSDPHDLDRTISISRWISFQRGVIELKAGEETTVPLEINIFSSATPGKRFARIALPNGSNRPKASDAMGEKSYAQIIINIEIVEDIVEKSQVKAFRTLRNVFLNAPVTFMLELNNSGNRAITPKGNLYIYNRRGEEVAKIDANPEVESIPVGETWDKSIDWSDLKGMGKFKARVEIEYGENEKRDLQDTVYFWVLPWKILLFLFFITFVFLSLMVMIIFRKSYHHHHYTEEEPASKGGQVEDNSVLNLKKDD